MGRGVLLLALLAVGVVIGAGAMLASTVINERTSSNEFCTSCHTMARLAEDPGFAHSAHMANAAGVRPSCGDCHIPSNNWFVETYTHAAQGLKDVISTYTHDFDEPGVWDAYRVKLAHEVRRTMRGQDSVTCRNCHDPADIHPASQAGQAAHRLLATQQLTCIDCHFNLVHAPVPPDMDFIRGSGLGVARTDDR